MKPQKPPPRRQQLHSINVLLVAPTSKTACAPGDLYLPSAWDPQDYEALGLFWSTIDRISAPQFLLYTPFQGLFLTLPF